MAHVLGDYIGKICLCYLDDVIIFDRTQKKLLDRLDLVLKRLFGLKVKPSKCVLFRTEIKFLGHLVSAAGVHPLLDKVSAISDWPTPRCLTDVRAFYGLVGYYRRFIAGFATIAEPLTRFTRKGTKFVWSSEADEAFARLKTAMLEVPTLAFPCPDRPCILDTDSSDVSSLRFRAESTCRWTRTPHRVLFARHVTDAAKLLLNSERAFGSVTLQTLFAECSSHPADRPPQFKVVAYVQET